MTDTGTGLGETGMDRGTNGTNGTNGSKGPSWVEAELLDSLDEELELELDDGESPKR
jgi:hypothetical protein